MIRGLNHITLAVSNLDESLDFYTRILGFKGHVKWDGGVYLSLGDIWLCLSLDTPSPSTDYTHIAFDIDEVNFKNFEKIIVQNDIKLWKKNTSEGKSLYILDPNGNKLEIHVGNLQTRLESFKQKPLKSGLQWL